MHWAHGKDLLSNATEALDIVETPFVDVLRANMYEMHTFVWIKTAFYESSGSHFK